MSQRRPQSAGEKEGGVRKYEWKERSREVVPVMETRMHKSLRQETGPAQGTGKRVQMGRWGLGLLHPAVLTLPLNLGKPNGYTSQPALSVTSSGTNCPGLKMEKKKRKEKESPHYMVGNPHTRDKIL